MAVIVASVFVTEGNNNATTIQPDNTAKDGRYSAMKLTTNDIIYLKKAIRLGTQSHGLDIPRLNNIVNTLQEKAESFDILMKRGETKIIEENNQLREKIGIALADQHCNNDMIISLEHERDELKEKVERVRNMPIGADFQKTRENLKEILGDGIVL